MVRAVRQGACTCNGACTVERSARQWHTDSRLSCQPVYLVSPERDKLSKGPTSVVGGSVTENRDDSGAEPPSQWERGALTHRYFLRRRTDAMAAPAKPSAMLALKGSNAPPPPTRGARTLNMGFFLSTR